MSIAQQSATAHPPVRTRHRHAPEAIAVPRPGPTLAKIGGLIALTAFAAALAAGVTGIALIMFVTAIGH